MSATTITKEMVTAGSGCAVANGCLNAFETTKVKLQLHQPHSNIYRNPSTAGVMRQIAAEEGIVRGLMLPGLGASVTRSMLYGAYRVGLYSTVRDFLGREQDQPTLQQRMISGMFTGGLGAMISCPLDVVRTRLQADSGNICSTKNIYSTGLRRGEAVRYRSMISAFSKIMRDEGLRHGLYRGASVTVARASLLNGSQLASYDTLKHHLEWKEGPLLHGTCAMASGVIAQSVIMPVDTVKSYMMLGNGWKTVFKNIQKNGPFWFYRGYLPACAGQGLIMVVQMPLIEEFRRLIGITAI
jgi:hypothetical protein